MKRALVVAVLPLCVWACGGEAASEPPPQTAVDAAPPPDEAPVDAPATDSAAAGADETWAGEEEAKAEPAAAGGDSKAPETRTMDVIAKLVKDNRQPVRDCMDKAKKELPDLKGDMVINFVIDPQGKVKKAELNQERSTLKAPNVVECAIKTIKGIEFPPSSRGMDTTVNYPYNLN